MSYSAVAIYDLSGAFLGYAIKPDGVDKLLNNNLWTEADTDDLKAHLQRLKEQNDIRAFWPNVRDVEVQALLDNPEWEPLELSPVEVVDEERSIFVWIEEPSDKNPFGNMDRESSDIVYKTQMAPAPARVQERVKKACEAVARARASALTGTEA